MGCCGMRFTGRCLTSGAGWALLLAASGAEAQTVIYAPVMQAQVMVPIDPVPVVAVQQAPAPPPPQIIVVQQPYIPPAPQVSVALTDDDRLLLAHGEYTDGEIVGGGLMALAFGFGTGHMVQGRWSEIGWLFTLGEIGSLVLMTSAISASVDDPYGGDEEVGWVFLGALGFASLRVWETIDAFVTPGRHNDRLRRIRFGIASIVTPDGTTGRAAFDGLSVNASLRF